MEKMIRVYQAATLLDAEIACVRLRKQGIEPRVEGDAVGIRGPATPVTVWVAAADAAVAVKILRRSPAGASSKKVSRRPARKGKRTPLARRR